MRSRYWQVCYSASTQNRQGKVTKHDYFKPCQTILVFDGHYYTCNTCIYRGYYTVARRYEFYVLVFLSREHKIHIFEPTCNVLFIIWRLNIETNSTKAKGGNRDVIERYDTHKGDIRKIRHSGPG